MKICTKCGEQKPLTEFPKNPRYKGGRLSYCRGCKNAYGRASSNKKSLSMKPECRRDGCNKRVPLLKSIYCSHKCSKKDHAKKNWEAQKQDPNYKEYHRKIAREWIRRKRDSQRASLP